MRAILGEGQGVPPTGMILKPASQGFTGVGTVVVNETQEFIVTSAHLTHMFPFHELRLRGVTLSSSVRSQTGNFSSAGWLSELSGFGGSVLANFSVKMLGVLVIVLAILLSSCSSTRLQGMVGIFIGPDPIPRRQRPAQAWGERVFWRIQGSGDK